MNEEIKWSKKEVVVRHHLDRYGRPEYQTFDVNVYRWKNYRLEKELYGENRSSYHIAKDNLYLCDNSGSFHVSFFNTIKSATLALENVLSYGLYDYRDYYEEEYFNRWVNPSEKYIFGLLSYKPKRDVDVDFDEYS